MSVLPRYLGWITRILVGILVWGCMAAAIAGCTAAPGHWLWHAVFATTPEKRSAEASSKQDTRPVREADLEYEIVIEPPTTRPASGSEVDRGH